MWWLSLALLVACEALEVSPAPDPMELEQASPDVSVGQDGALDAAPDAALLPDAGPLDGFVDAGLPDASGEAPWPGPCVYERFDADGHPLWRVVYTYNDERRLEGEEVDFEADGVFDLHRRRAYTEEGWLQEQVTDYLEPEADYLDERKVFTYDRQGRVLTETTDQPLNGSIDYRSSHVYDDVARTDTWRQEGSFGVSVEISYLDEHGHTLRVERDEGGFAVMALTHDEAGRLLMSEADSGEDGSINFRSTFTYHSNGAFHVIEHDFDADGAPEFRTVRDRRGTIVEEYVNYGERHYRRRCFLDDAGNLIRDETDFGDDGTVDFFGRYTDDCWLNEQGG